MMRLKRSIAPLVICAILLPGPSRAQTPPNPSQRTVDVTGHGDANAKPDAMIVAFSVDNQAPTADECTRAHAEKVRKIIDALKEKLGADTKIETADYSLNPNTTYVNAPAPAQPQEPKAQWSFKANVVANSDSLELTGALIDSAMAAGATRLQNSGFGEVPDDAAATPTFFWRRKHRHPMKQAAFINMEVETQGSSAHDATRKGSERVAQVQKVMRERVGDHGTVKVSQFSIMQIDPNLNRYVPPAPQPATQQVQNYAAHTTVTVETSKLDLLGPVVQAGIDSGATRLNQVQFTLRNDTQARKDAMEKASAEAKTKADTVAKSMGVTLGKILRISTNAQVRPQTIYGNNFQMAAHQAQSYSAAVVPVLPREVGFSADVTVDYEIE
jgi:uncharacterized protein YggE